MKRTVRRFATAVLVVSAVWLGLGACSGGDADRGMAADRPAAVVGELLERYATGGDYGVLLSTKADKAEVDEALEAFKAAGGAYTIVESGSAMYESINGEAADVAAGETLLGIYGGSGTSFGQLKGEGYAMVRHNEQAGTYVVVDFDFRK
ncbi:MAG: hypothetical protein LBC97_13770 [Bifidobacteriaceae bacterium]|jgi:hypothetical protein|nr:hypothetical protein [Bifidobacteriaceae bacterium]